MKLKGILEGIPVWEAVIDGAPNVSCEVVSLGSAVFRAQKMADAGQPVIGLTDGEITISGEQFARLLADPDAIHMHNSKLYDSSAVLAV